MALYINKKGKKDQKEKDIEKDIEKDKKKAKNIYYIFRKGSSIDEFTPTLAIIDSNKYLLIELSTSNTKKYYY